MTEEEKRAWDEAEEQYNSSVLHMIICVVALVVWMIVA